MDTSPRYVKMCKEAIELRQGHKWENGDFYWDIDIESSLNRLKDTKGIQKLEKKEPKMKEALEKNRWCCGVVIDKNFLCDCGLETSLFPFEAHASSETAIWLPRQDQLQPMVNENINYAIACGGFFDIHINSQKMGEIFNRNFTWEQLWLQFVIWHNYNKVWDNEREEWIKKEK
jgi:hypothetical protein